MKIVISDVDGVLTDGGFYYGVDGKTLKRFGPHDSDGVKMLKSNNIDVKFVTADARGFRISKSRINDMNCELYLVSELERYSYLDQTFGLNNIIYIGDGFYDAKILKDCYYGICPKSGRKEAKFSSDYVTDSCGGDGVLLDSAIKIIKDDLWK